jgi:hypothetical protein
MGFVSNSSSSSFIVAVPKNMELNVENVIFMLWPDVKDHNNLKFNYYSENSVNAIDVAIRVLDDLKLAEKDKNNEKMIKESLNGLYYKNNILFKDVGSPPTITDDLYKLPVEEFKNILDKFEKDRDEFNSKIYDIFLKHNSDCDIYVLNYSDNNGEFETIMEHGGIFDDMIKRGNALMINNH